MMFSTDFSDFQVTRMLTWDDDAIYSSLFGFAFDNSEVLHLEAALVEADAFMWPVHSGFVDFDANFGEAMERLEEAGLREYKAEIERQVNAFLDANNRRGDWR
jgi:hypothetical protein